MPSRFGVAHPRGNTAAQHGFAMVPSASIERSVFNRSNGLKTAFSSGYLVPVFADEALPGDTFQMRTTSFVRMATPVYPLMDNLYLDVFYFAVPLRLLWDNFKKFMGEQVNPGDSTSFNTPIFNSFTPATSSLSDYLGIPARGVAYASGNSPIVSFWHRAYNFIWNEWFRDENLQNSVVVDRDDGPDDIADYVLLRRGKRHDYFTSCLPFLQKGNAVQLPLGTKANVTGDNAVGVVLNYYDKTAAAWRNLDRVTIANYVSGSSTGAGGTSGSQLYADLSTATAATINQIREAFQIQKLLERDARGGTRYTEIVRSHFGVVSPDARLQRPEYLGGGSTRIAVHPVAQTNAGSTAGNPLTATLGGFATGVINGVGFSKSFTEHCVILGLANVRADLSYQQGINRMFSRRTRYDYYWPAFAHLGEQAVKNREIYANGDSNDDLVFGYQERYAEYRYKPSLTTGVMNSNAATPIDKWHLGLKFTSLPALNSVFIPDQPPMARVVAVSSEPEFYGDFWFDLKCARPMPTFSVPGLIDHF